MNAQRRKQIEAIKARVEALQDLISEAQNIADEITQEVRDVLELEQEAYDNMPESLQDGERGQAMNEAIGNLEQATNLLEEISVVPDMSEVIDLLSDAQGA